MKKILALFISIIMLFSTVTASASTLDFLRIPYRNSTVESEVKLKFDNIDEFFETLTEITGELSYDVPIDIKMLVKSLCSSTEGTVVKTDISDDYKKIKIFVSTDADVFADVNENLSLSAEVTTAMWVDFDISDMANPKCKVISYSPYSAKYVHFDLFEMLFESFDENQKMMFMSIMYSFLNEDFITKTIDYLIDKYEIYGEVVTEGNVVTVKFDNSGFLKLFDELVEYLVAEFMGVFTFGQSVETDFAIPSIADTGLVILGENGFVTTYTLEENGNINFDSVMDIKISCKNIGEVLGVEFPYEEDLVLELTVLSDEKVFDIGKTVIEFPELNDENSISMEDLMDLSYSDGYYPHYWFDVETDVLPDTDGLYVPFVAMMHGAYDDYVVIERKDNLITITGNKFVEFETLSFTVGESVAYLDGKVVENVDEILEVDGTVFVSRQFLQNVLGWDIIYMVYNISDQVYNIEISTDPYFDFEDDEYYEDDDYYVDDVVSGECEYLPIIDGEAYLPFRGVIEDHYGADKIKIVFENGTISVSSDYYEDFIPFSFVVGTDVITVEGKEIEAGKTFIENGTTYVHKDFFENGLGWIVDYIKYDYIDGTFEYAISTSFSEYPAHFSYVRTEYIPVSDEYFYVPLEKAIAYAYDEYYSMSNENGVVTLESRLFNGFEKIVLNVGSDVSVVDGKEVSIEAIVIEENSIVYVPIEFFYNVFGWELYFAEYDMLDEELMICFDTASYYES